MNAAQKILELLGGAGPVSQALELEHSTVWRWTKDRAQRGTGGHVPRWHHPKLLAYAGRKRKRAEVSALLGYG